MNSNEELFIRIGLAIAKFKRHYHIKKKEVIVFDITIKDQEIVLEVELTNKNDTTQKGRFLIFKKTDEKANDRRFEYEI